jgi:hypothetical protein
MSEIGTQRRFEILAVLKGTLCWCRSAKQVMRSHCRRCYFALPPAMRQALYSPFGNGYEEAYEASVKFLKERNSE